MKDELFKNTLIIGVGRVLTQFMGLLLLPLYTAFLSPSQYGIGDLIITYAALAIPLATLSLEQGAFRLLLDSRENEQQKTFIISFVVRTATLLAVVLGMVALLCGVYLYPDSTLVVVALVYILSSISLHICLWLARGLGANIPYAKGSIAVGSASLLLNILLVAALGYGVKGMLAALSLANVVGVVYFIASLKLYKYVRLRADNRQIDRELLGYSLPLVPNSLSWWFVNVADRTLITLFLGAAATGIYAVAAKFPAILVGLFAIFWISWHESASQYIDHPDRNAFFSKVTNSSFMLFGSLGLVLIAGVSVFFKYFIAADFHQAYIYIPILMISALCHAIITLYGSVYAAKKRTKQILNTTVLAAVINVVLLVVLIDYIGLFAAALASVIAYLSLLIYRHYDVKQYVHISLDLRKLAILILAAVGIIVVYYINQPILNVINLTVAICFALIMNKGIFLSLKDMLWKKSLKS